MSIRRVVLDVCRACLAVAGIGLSCNALAQTAPDAGTLRQQIEREQRPVLPPRANPLNVAPAAPLKLPDGARITVRQFRFEGHSQLDEAALQETVKVYRNREIGFAELQRATQDVAQRFRDAGWIATAYLPAQDVTDGVVTIRVVEAIFAGARLEGTGAVRLDGSAVLEHVQAQQATGRPLSAQALDRALLLADDLAGAIVAGALEPGQRDGETALVLQITDGPAAGGEVSLDNGGSRSTGAGRVVIHGEVYSPSLRGDLLRAQAMLSDGSQFLRLAYERPLGARGLKLALQGSWLDYRLVGSSFAALGGQGRSGSAGAELRYPLVRSRQQNLYLSGSLDLRRYVNEANSGTQSDYDARSLTVSLDGNRFDNLGGGGASQGSLTVQRGRIALGTLDAAEDAARGGTFTKLKFSALHRQTLSGTWSALLSVRGQYASRPLDSSERFYLGGPDGVRAYPANEGSGSQGALANLELRWQAMPDISVAALIDGGQVRDPGAATTRLKGAGASVAWTGPQGLTARLIVARRIGANPNPTATGSDQDGTLVRNRLWVQASMRF